MTIIKKERVDLLALASERQLFEKSYGLPSSRLAEAFISNGRLVETEEFRRWTHIHTVLERYGALAGV